MEAAAILFNIHASVSNRHKDEQRRSPSIDDMRALMIDLGPTSKTAREMSCAARDSVIREVFFEWFPDFYAQFRFDEKRARYVPRYRSLREERLRRLRLQMK